MDLLAGCRLSIEDKPAPADRGRLSRELGKYNAGFFHRPKSERLGVFVRDPENDVVAGLAGYTSYADWLFVENLWVHEQLRRRGIGQELLACAEQRARERGCHSAWLDTWSFQGPEFYPKFGYTVFGTLDYPPGFKRFFLQKRLLPEM